MYTDAKKIAIKEFQVKIKVNYFLLLEKQLSDQGTAVLLT